jgi:hypothetical protein
MQCTNKEQSAFTHTKDEAHNQHKIAGIRSNKWIPIGLRGIGYFPPQFNVAFRD